MTIVPFQISLSQPTRDDPRDHLARTRWPDEIAGAGPSSGAARRSCRGPYPGVRWCLVLLQGRTILVVEDERSAWRAIEDLLAREGAVVLQTPDEQACETLASGHPPDVVVLDVHAAGEVRACLQAAPHLQAVPVVVIPPDIHLWLAQQGEAYRRQRDHSQPPAQVRTLLSSIQACLR